MIKDLLNMARAKATMMIMSKGSIKNIEINEMPKEWSYFMDTKDKYINVDYPEGEKSSVCIYVGKKGSVLPPHFHSESVEHFVVLNREGKVKSVTCDKISEVSFPDAVFYEKNQTHAVEFLEDTKLLIIWHPKFKNGWTGEFVKGKKLVEKLYGAFKEKEKSGKY